MTKKISYSFIVVLISVTIISAQIPNPSFGGKRHQISAQFGRSLRSFDHLEDLFIWGISYGQPHNFFMLPGRLNLEFILERGFGEYSKYDNLLAGISQDIVFPIFFWLKPKPISNLYFSANLGGYIGTEKTDRISSIFTFGQKAVVGYNIKEIITLEFYGQHYSNGTLTEKNSGFEFICFSVIWNFSFNGNSTLYKKWHNY